MKQPPLGWTTIARIVRVVDGDTVDVEVVRLIRVRLEDCWAPEVGTKDESERAAGEAASEYLRQLLGADTPGRMVIMHIPTRARKHKANESSAAMDIKYSLTLDRFIGRLFADGVDVGEGMVAAGHATAGKQAMKLDGGEEEVEQCFINS